MSTLTVGYIVGVVEKKALDEENDDFAQAELIGLYNLALRFIVSLVPRAYAITTSELLAPGTLQSVPATGLVLSDVVRNTGTDGKTPGPAITKADLAAMNTLVPSWSSETATEEIDNFMRIPGMDASFFVSPPSDGTGYVQMVYSAMPPTTTYDDDGDWEDDKIPISDEFVPALPDAMLYNAYDDDTDTPGNLPRSQMYYQRAVQILGIKDTQTQGRK